MDIRITGAKVLAGNELVETSVHTGDGVVAEIGSDCGASNMIDASGLLLLPGIVDIHGDAFERQMMPRPGVDFALDLALIYTDRQVIANGITTVFHGVTWSWEPGLRGPENARNLLTAIEALQPRLAADTRYHLRFETFNFSAEPEARAWLDERKIDALAFNDHMLKADYATNPPSKLGTMIERTGLSREDFFKLIASLRSRSDEVPDLITGLAKSANAASIPLISHDDSSTAAIKSYSARRISCAAKAMWAGSMRAIWLHGACAQFLLPIIFTRRRWLPLSGSWRPAYYR
jgi:alpha-D-ribose 1-methylphosphonate 5-triphosphate diphosphatase